MFYYYIVVLLVALFFYGMLLILKKKIPGISSRMCIFVVLWALSLSFILPLIISIVSPGASLLIIFFLFLLGGFLIVNRVNVSDKQREVRVLRNILSAVYSDTVKGLTLEPEEVVQEVSPVSLDQTGWIMPKEEYPFLLPKNGNDEETGKEVFLLPNKELSCYELFESAFQARQEGKYALAVEKLKLSLAGTADISLKGLIYTELVFLYKEMGKYLEAAGMIQGFISENSAALAPALRRQFTLLVEFLQAVDQLLIKADQPGIPYSKVPRLIKLRAEKMLKE